MTSLGEYLNPRSCSKYFDFVKNILPERETLVPVGDAVARRCLGKSCWCREGRPGVHLGGALRHTSPFRLCILEEKGKCCYVTEICQILLMALVVPLSL